jgi:hypothetical protein
MTMTGAAVGRNDSTSRHDRYGRKGVVVNTDDVDAGGPYHGYGVYRCLQSPVGTLIDQRTVEGKGFARRDTVCAFTARVARVGLKVVVLPEHQSPCTVRS